MAKLPQCHSVSSACDWVHIEWAWLIERTRTFAIYTISRKIKMFCLSLFHFSLLASPRVKRRIDSLFRTIGEDAKIAFEIHTSYSLRCRVAVEYRPSGSSVKHPHFRHTRFVSSSKSIYTDAHDYRKFIENVSTHSRYHKSLKKICTPKQPTKSNSGSNSHSSSNNNRNTQIIFRHRK